MQGGRRVRPEEGGEALAVGQSRGAGAVGQLRKTDRQTDTGVRHGAEARGENEKKQTSEGPLRLQQ